MSTHRVAGVKETERLAQRREVGGVRGVDGEGAARLPCARRPVDKEGASLLDPGVLRCPRPPRRRQLDVEQAAAIPAQQVARAVDEDLPDRRLAVCGDQHEAASVVSAEEGIADGAAAEGGSEDGLVAAVRGWVGVESVPHETIARDCEMQRLAVLAEEGERATRRPRRRAMAVTFLSEVWG